MVKIKKLDSGVSLVTESIPHVQSVSFGVWIKAGAADETKKTAGISHLIEHMMFKGTETRSARQIAEDVDKIGSHINAFTGKEATCYYIKSLDSNLKESVDIVMDMFLNSVFDKAELEKEKHVIYEEMKMIEDSPEDYIHDMICEMVFRDTPLAQPIIGLKSSLSRVTRNGIKRYIGDEYTRDSIIISVAGKFDEDEIERLLGDKLCALQASKGKKGYADVPYFPCHTVKVKDIEQANICLGVPGVKLDDEKYYAFAVLNNILGGSMSSRLFQSIREEKGLAYSVYTSSTSFVDTGLFNIYTGVSHENAEKTISAVKDELLKMKHDGVSKDELSAAKEQLKGSYIFSQESVNGRMFANGRNMTLLGKVFLPEEVISGIDKVKREDIEEVSPLVTDIRNYSAAMITNKRADLKKWIG